MSAVDETIVREFFERHGFLVCQRRKYVVQARRKTADEEVNLVVLNPQAKGEPQEIPFEIAPDTLGRLSRAIVAVKGWHTEVFVPSVLKHQPKIFRFAEKAAIDEARRLIGADDLTKVLVIPSLPKNAKVRQESIDVLKARGVDCVLSFRAILEDLVAGVSTNRNYSKSDLLQTLRLLKNYDLLRDPQMEFRLKPRRRKGNGDKG